MIEVPQEFKPHINTDYPPKNTLIFEEWFYYNYNGCNTDREYLPIFPTSYHVNNSYGTDVDKLNKLQSYCDTLDSNKKYFILCQYDDGCLINWKGKDVLEFNMSKKNGIEIPLICIPHEIKYNLEKKYLVSFIGNITHNVRREIIDYYSNKDEYYISTEHHDYDSYNKILSESIFSLCPRGYGSASFRCYSESIYQGAIPVYISDEHIIPFGIDFNKFGVLINNSEIANVDYILRSIPLVDIIKKQDALNEYYLKYFTYKGCLNNIIKSLENEAVKHNFR